MNASYEFSNRFKTVWSLRQIGQHLAGTVKFIEIGESNYAEFGLRG